MGLQRVGDDRATKQKRNIAWRICMSVYEYAHMHTYQPSLLNKVYPIESGSTR